MMSRLKSLLSSETRPTPSPSVQPHRLREWDRVRTYVADYLLRVFIPTIAIISALAGVLTTTSSWEPEHLLIEIGFGSTVLLPWFFYRRGDPLRGIASLVIGLTVASVATVLFTGGIFEPAYLVLIAILTMAAWFFSNRAVALFVLSFLGLGLFTSQLMKIGVIAPKVRPDEDWYVVVITVVALVVAVTITTIRSLFRDVLMDLDRLRADQHRAQIALEDERAHLTVRVAERTAELTATNADLAAASRSKDEFLASMSHELRTPLNVILNVSELIQEGLYGPVTEKQKRSVGMVETSGLHLLSLIDDILDLAKVGAGTIDLAMETISPEDVCHASLNFVRDSASTKGLKVLTSFDQQVTTIRADKRRLKQILINLLNNAVKFTPEGGSIGLEVTGCSEDNIVHFSVWDTGVGISAEEQKLLFKPFVQLDAGLNRAYDGTGLGLSLVARMTELHGGGVHLESPGHGLGARFTISLPWSDPMIERSLNASSPQVPLAPQPIPDMTSKTGAETETEMNARPLILLAEDNEFNITSTCDFLKAKGYRLIVARTGVEAIELNREARPALILMDVQMPMLDGLDATREIRKDPAFAEVPIIALTALAMQGDRKRCLAAGATEYMSKPVRLKKLHEAIQRLLSGDAN
jgi:signal transduction histidine kinase/CheY-like chemotaxis protein